MPHHLCVEKFTLPYLYLTTLCVSCVEKFTLPTLQRATRQSEWPDASGLHHLFPRLSPVCLSPNQTLTPLPPALLPAPTLLSQAAEARRETQTPPPAPPAPHRHRRCASCSAEEGSVALCRARAAVPPRPAPLPPGRGWRGSFEVDAALLAHGHQLRLLLVVHLEVLHARGGAMSIGRGRGVWRGGRLAPSSSGRPPP